DRTTSRSPCEHPTVSTSLSPQGPNVSPTLSPPRSRPTTDKRRSAFVRFGRWRTSADMDGGGETQWLRALFVSSGGVPHDGPPQHQQNDGWQARARNGRQEIGRRWLGRGAGHQIHGQEAGDVG